MIRALVLVVSAYLAVILPDFIPAMPFFAGAHVLLLPIVVCYALLWMPFPAAVGFALGAGLAGDLATLHVDGERVEIGLGWSMLFYVLLAAALEIAVRKSPRLRWETHCLSSGAAAFLFLAGQYAMIGLRRGDLAFDGATFAQIAGPALSALLLAPLFYLFFGLFPAQTRTKDARRTTR